MSIRLTPLAAALALAFVAPLPALAQTDSTATTGTDGTALPTVTVNASADASAEGLPAPYAGGQVARGGRVGFLGNKDYLSTPFNTTSYTSELIKDQQTRSVADVLQNDPSVRISRGFGNFQELYMIRGFPLYSDDLAYNGLYGLLPRQYVATELLERVEVLRGASAFLNGMTPGSTAVGGTINLLPKRATTEPLSQATVGWETGGQVYTAADIGRRFGPDERMGIRVNAARREGGTAIDNENRELNLASIGLDYRGNSFRLSADIGYQEQKLRQPRPSVTIGTFIPNVPGSSTNYAQPWSYSDERDIFGTLRGEFDLSQNVMAWVAYGSRFGTESNSLSPITVSAADGSASSYRFDNRRRDYVRTGEAGIRAKFATAAIKHEVTATASVYKQDIKNAYALGGAITTSIYAPVAVSQPATTTAATDGGDMANPRTTETIELTSVALADTLSFLDDRLQVTAGARYQNIKDVSYAYFTAAQTGAYDKSAVTPLLAAVYRLTDSVSVYGNYSQGLQKGPTAIAPASNAGQVFAPYKSRQKELGLKYDGGKLGGSLAVFSTNKPNTVTENNVTSLNGEQRNRGIELSAFGTPMRGLKVLGGITLLEAKQTHTQSGTNDGKDAVGVPRTQANLGAELDVPGVQGLSLNARAVYTGAQYGTSANNLQIGAWTRYDLGARYLMNVGQRVVTVRARVDNVLNKNYWSAVTHTDFSDYLVQSTPRTFTLSASVDF
ncbi:TonB-dependent siderophore receptor [Herbaspirillum sp. YR522]|uniref:TonB-dependent receptor n=1 Tax=Herbaspirillum sp. YR522 TaxID=1144342 RepID=UPI00026F90ED|nr:TonB-dependent siderophore receptor [Herbaspirillum sp. YR522]EJN07997.1 TonB-dependent siderophore receptor [Herbaspirillum sp. YR522]